jgi:hypothetical protein
MIKFFYYTGLFLICFFLCFDFFNSYIYDPCGYVGASNDPIITDFCLATSTDCCYIKWTYNTSTYYACVSKTKLIESAKNENITTGFTKLLSDSSLILNISYAISSKCNSTEGVIITPEVKKSSFISSSSSGSSTTGRRLIQGETSDMNLDYQTEHGSYFGSIHHTVGYYLKYLVYKVLNLLFF